MFEACLLFCLKNIIKTPNKKSTISNIHVLDRLIGTDSIHDVNENSQTPLKCNTQITK